MARVRTTNPRPGLALPRVVASLAFYPRRARQPFQILAASVWSPHPTRRGDVLTVFGSANRERNATTHPLLGKGSRSFDSFMSNFLRAARTARTWQKNSHSVGKRS